MTMNFVKDLESRKPLVNHYLDLGKNSVTVKK